jgi:hypothetical protein
MISLRVEVWAHTTNFIPPLFVEIPEPNQQGELPQFESQMIKIAERGKIH